MEIVADLKPDPYRETLLHELGHVGELKGYAAGHFKLLGPDGQAKLLSELRQVSRAARPGFWSGHRAPKAVGRGINYVDKLPELYADAQLTYSRAPTAFKKLYPAAAAFVRDVWNSVPRLRDEIGFNLLPLGIGLGSLGLGVGASRLDEDQ